MLMQRYAQGTVKEKIYELLGIGFGPAAISFAAAVADHKEKENIDPLGTMCFIERGNGCKWHDELLFRHADINHHLLRDLVTPRNPRSFYSFANYLKTKGRLYSFGLTGRQVSRVEWSDYVDWVGTLLSGDTIFNTSVEDLAVSTEVDGTFETICATSSDDRMFHGRCILISNGAQPHVPNIFYNHLGDRIFHSSTYSTSIGKFSDLVNVQSALVIGSGMSAAEIVVDLYNRFPNCAIYSIHRSHGFRLNDLSNFSSEVYSPEETEYVFGLDSADRLNVLRESWQTNYSGLDSDGGNLLYNTMYLDEVQGSKRIFMEKRRQVVVVRRSENKVDVDLYDRNAGNTKSVSVDFVVVATGFKVDPMSGLLGGLEEHLMLDEGGSPIVSRNYRVATKSSLRARIYLNGQCENTHGISDAQSFSLLAERAGRIFNDIVTDCTPEYRLARDGGAITEWEPAV